MPEAEKLYALPDKYFGLGNALLAGNATCSADGCWQLVTQGCG